MTAGTIKIKLMRSPICTPEKHKSDRAGAGAAEDEPGRGAAGYAGVPRHGEEDSASAGNRRVDIGVKVIMNLSQLKTARRGRSTRSSASGRAWAPAAASTSGRGAKGAQVDFGLFSIMRGFEGGQMPLHRRLPKRGFTNIFQKEYAIVNLGALEKLEGDTLRRRTALLRAGRRSRS